jgi:hypothetical protein
LIFAAACVLGEIDFLLSKQPVQSGFFHRSKRIDFLFESFGLVSLRAVRIWFSPRLFGFRTAELLRSASVFSGRSLPRLFLQSPPVLPSLYRVRFWLPLGRTQAVSWFAECFTELSHGQFSALILVSRPKCFPSLLALVVESLVSVLLFEPRQREPIVPVCV